MIEAFSSTLEEALSADGIIIVADASHIDAVGSLNTTIEALRSLGGDEKIKLLIINKVDSYSDDITLSKLRSYPYRTVETSFKTGVGIADLFKALEEITDELFFDAKLIYPLTSVVFGEIQNDGYIKRIEYKENFVEVDARLPRMLIDKYSNFMA